MGAYHLKDHPYRLHLRCAILPVENGHNPGTRRLKAMQVTMIVFFFLILRDCLIFQVSSPFKMFLHFDT